MPAVGEQVTIFEDPVSQQLPEGTAILVQKIRMIPGIYNGGRLRLCKVRFPFTGLNAERIYQRAIWEPLPPGGPPDCPDSDD